MRLGAAGVEDGRTWVFIGEKCREGEGETGGAKSGIECLVQGQDIGHQRVCQDFVGPVYLRLY